MTLKFVVGDHKYIEFQMVMTDPDPPFKPLAIDLDTYDEVKFFAKQIGPAPEDPSTFTPKEFEISGSILVPAEQGYVGFDFTSANLDTMGEYICTIKLYKTGTEIWSCAENFYMTVREY